VASGGPAGGQTFETLDKHVFVGGLDKFMFEGGCSLPRGTRGKEHPQSAFEVAHLAAGSQLKDASGGPAGGQIFEKFDKQVLKNTLG